MVHRFRRRFYGPAFKGTFIKRAYFDNVRHSHIDKYRYDVSNKLRKLPNSQGIEGKFLPMLIF